ncbi:MAG: STAS domain-containing protein [Pseudomonadota bacterium]
MGKVLLAEENGVNVLKLVGDIRLTLGPTLGGFISRIGHTDAIRSIVIDLSETECIDSTALGLLAKLSLRSQEALNRVPVIVSPREDISRILSSMGFEDVFVIVHVAQAAGGLEGCEKDELPTQLASEEVLCDQVLEAHRVLMSLNAENAERFAELVDALEAEKSKEPPRLRLVR